MKKPVRLAVQLVLAGLVVTAVACRAPSKPVKFNNEIARSNARLAAAAKAFNKSLQEEVFNGKEGAAKKLRGHYDTIVKLVADLQDEYKRIRPPVGSKEGRNLLEKYQEFLAGQKAIVDGPLQEIMTIVESGPLDGGAHSRIDTLKGKIAEEETKARDALIDAQNAYATERKFKPQ